MSVPSGHLPKVRPQGQRSTEGRLIKKMSEQIILVDEKDNQIGTGEKMATHRQGLLHRAFSIFVFNDQGQVMLQQRAKSKYHSGGKWSNTCCSHPRKGESLDQAVHRRLQDEMGFDCELSEKTSLIYKVALDHGLIEHEYLHVYSGLYDGQPKLNPEEADDYKWLTLEELTKDITKQPEIYSEWLKIIIKEHLNSITDSLK